MSMKGKGLWICCLWWVASVVCGQQALESRRELGELIRVFREQMVHLPGGQARKSGARTLLDGCGNSAELTQAFQLLLAEQGLESRLVEGMVSLEARQVAQWLPTLAAGRLLDMTRTADGRWQVPMTWLQCRSEYYPRLAGGRQGNEWVDVFPGLVGADELCGEWLKVENLQLTGMLRLWQQARTEQAAWGRAASEVRNVCQSLLERQGEYGASPEVLRGQGAIYGYRSANVLGRRPVVVLSQELKASAEDERELTVTVRQGTRVLLCSKVDLARWLSGCVEVSWRDADGAAWPTGELLQDTGIYGRRLFAVLRTEAGEAQGEISGFAGQGVTVELSLPTGETVVDERRLGDVCCYVVSGGGYCPAEQEERGAEASLLPEFCRRLGLELRERLDMLERLLTLSFADVLSAGYRVSLVAVCPTGPCVGDAFTRIDGYEVVAGECSRLRGERATVLGLELGGVAVTSELLHDVCGGEVDSVLRRYARQLSAAMSWSATSQGAGMSASDGALELSWRGGDAGRWYEVFWQDEHGQGRRGWQTSLRGGLMAWSRPLALRGNDCLSVLSVLGELRAGGVWETQALPGELSTLSAWSAYEEQALRRPRIGELTAEQRYAGDEARMWFSLSAEPAEAWSVRVLGASGQQVFAETGTGGQIAFSRKGEDASGRRCPDGWYEVQAMFSGPGGQVSGKTRFLWDATPPEVGVLAYVTEREGARQLVVEYALEDLQAVTGVLKVMSADGREVWETLELPQRAGVETLAVPAGHVCLVEVTGCDAYGNLGGAQVQVVLGTVYAGGRIWRPEGAVVPQSVNLGLAIDSPRASECVDVGLLPVTGSASFPAGRGDGGYQLRLFGGDGRLLECAGEEREGRWCLSYCEPPAGSRREDVEMSYPTRQATVVSGELGLLDVSGLPNGVYVLELVGLANGAVDSCSLEFVLDSDLKAGLVEFGEVDGTVRVGGLSLQVSRSYSSARRSAGDCGVGWRQSFSTFDLELYDERMEAESIDGSLVSLRYGGSRDVTLTLPDGKRVTFAFDLRPGGGWSYAYYGTWTPLGTCKWSLRAQGGSNVTALPGLEPYWQATGPGIPLDYYDFPGYVLSGPDGSEYVFERERLGDYDATLEEGGSVSLTCYGAPRLKQVAFADGRRVILRDNELLMANGADDFVSCLRLTRDSDGRITRLEGGDVDVLTLAFAYDRLGNLVSCSRAVNGEPLVLRRRYYYDHARYPHLLTRIENGAGRQIASFDFDAQGRLNGVGDGEASVRSDHDVFAKIKLDTDPYGNETLYRHDEKGRITEIVYPDGGVVTYGYDAQGNETRRVDELGFVTTCDYDETGRVRHKINALGGVIRFDYDAQGRPCRLTGADGGYVYTRRSVDGRQVEIGSSKGVRMDCENDAEGRPLRLRSSWLPQTLSIRYHDDERAMVMDDGTGNVIQAQEEEQGQCRTLRYQWLDGDDNHLAEYVVSLEGDRHGLEQRLVFGDGSWQETRRDEEGVLRENSHSNGSWQRHGYDAKGRQVLEWTNDGWISCQVYDYGGRLVLSAGPEKFELEGAQQPPSELQFARGVTYAHDVRGRETSRCLVNDVRLGLKCADDGVWSVSLLETGSVVAQSLAEYDVRGQLVRQVDAAGVEQRIGYDGLGQIVWQEDGDGHRTQLEYDQAGRRTAVVNPLGERVAWNYDERGLLRKITSADGSTVSLEYAGQHPQATKVTRSGCLPLFLERNEYGLLLGASEGDCRMSYEYDLAQRFTAYENGRGQRWLLERDALGRMVSTATPEGRQRRYVYEGAQQVFSRCIDGKGDRLENLLPTAENPVSRQHVYTGGRLEFCLESPHQDECRKLDAAGRVLSHEQWRRDAHGRRESRFLDGQCANSYTYDAVGRLATCDTPGSAFALHYNHLGQVAGYRYTRSGGHDVSAPFDVAFTYDAAGRLIAEHYGQDWKREYTYDAGGRISNLVVRRGDVVQLSCDYLVSDAGQYTGLVERQLVNGEQVTRTLVWQYDAQGRLVSERSRSNIPGDRNFDWSAQYDDVDNLMAETLVTTQDRLDSEYAYDRDNCLVRSRHVTRNGETWDVVYTWDANGALELEQASGSRRWQRRYQWNAARQLLSVTLEEEAPELRREQVTFRYDARGTLCGHRRVRSQSGQEDVVEHRFNLERHVFQSLPQVLDYEEVHGDGTSRRTSLLLGGGGPLALTTGSRPPEMLQYLPHGELRRRGEAWCQHNAWSEPVRDADIPSGPRLHGEWTEAATGLVYLRSRFYSPRLRRFISPDTVEGIPEQPRSFHKYAYCLNDPVNRHDPQGTMSLGSVMTAMKMILTINLGSKTFLWNYVKKNVVNLAFISWSINDAIIQEKEQRNATLFVHGVMYHQHPEWANDMKNLLIGCGAKNQDYYVYTWGGFNFWIPMAENGILDFALNLLICPYNVLPIPNFLQHNVAVYGLWHTCIEILYKNYDNFNVISHSWGTLLSSNVSYFLPVSLSYLVTMGSPMWTGIDMPNTMEWLNVFDYLDPVIYLGSSIANVFTLGRSRARGSDTTMPLFCARNKMLTQLEVINCFAVHSGYWTNLEVVRPVRDRLKRQPW